MIHQVHPKGIQMKQLVTTTYLCLFFGVTIHAMENKPPASIVTLYNAHQKATKKHSSSSSYMKQKEVSIIHIKVAPHTRQALAHCMNKRFIELLRTFHITQDDDNSHQDIIEDKLFYAKEILEIGAQADIMLNSSKQHLKNFIQVTPALHIFDYCYQKAVRTNDFLSSQETMFKPPEFLSSRDLLEKWLRLLKEQGADLNILYKVSSKDGQKTCSLTLCDAMQNVDYNWYLYFTRIFDLKSAQQIKNEEQRRKNKEFLRELYKYHP